MVKRTEGTSLKLSSINSKENIEKFSKYLVSLLLLFKSDKKSFESIIGQSISYLPNVIKFTEKINEFDFYKIKDFVGDCKYGAHIEIYYLFRNQDFILKFDNDVFVINESSMIADADDMKRFVFEIAEKIYDYKTEKDYIEACRKQAEDYLTNCIRFGLEKFSNYIFENLDTGDKLQSLVDCFFLDFKSIDPKYRPITFCENKRIRQYNPTIFGDKILSDCIDRDMAYTRFHSGYEIPMSHFYLSFMDIDFIYKLSKNKMKTFAVLAKAINHKKEKPSSRFADKRYYNPTKTDNVIKKLSKNIPKFIKEYAESNDESFIYSGLYFLSIYIEESNKSNLDSLKKSLSCKNQGIVWCKDLIKNISLLVKKLQSTKVLG